MTFRSTFARVVSHWLLVDLAEALSLRETSPALLHSEADIEPTNQALHSRPERHRTYRRVAEGESVEVEQHLEAYRKAGQLLGQAQNMYHSGHILRFVMSHPEAPVLPPGGCLYLPNDGVWASFYQHVEHPFPDLFAEMIANSYYPSCNETSLSGLRLPASCGDRTMRGSRGCFEVSSLGSATGIQVFETTGHVGLPGKWSYHIENARPHQLRHAKESDASPARCGMSHELPEVPAAKRLEIPTRYVVCRRSDADDSITEDMVREQNRWANEAFRGASPWERMGFDKGRPVSVDMQISFQLVNISIVTNADCAKYGFTDTARLYEYNKDSSKYFTVVIITNDASGVLGQTEFPFDIPEDSPDHMVIVSSVGFRHFASHQADAVGVTMHSSLMYDEGDTVVHETGHGLGLYHTFERGCSNGAVSEGGTQASWRSSFAGSRGDMVDDTNSEKLPHYDCAVDMSCGEVDPVHNFMDYSPDSCMMGFTEGQKRRAWCVLENHRHGLYEMSLKE
ncbi:unnamed protein product [Prorocentrum cordatum]|uniref:Peptidase M43 pregnancy-associated plasma-A domain-containing protein n=1 Tax=Prorocentrum cordatum TaxID=2364126 RepID=A0ABN9TYJ0_9DINO|nr:unnamed protein product [Polarella glacialis]